MNPKLPFVLVGDHPSVATGLGRILGDLARHIQKDFGEMLDVRVVGWVPWGGIPFTGVEREIDINARDREAELVPFTTWAFNDTQKDWGASALIHAYRTWFGARDGFMFTVWDPGRCLPYAIAPLPVVKWGYFAVDAENVNGSISGPAAECLRKYDRLLAYTKFGANIVAKVTDDAQQPYLPHGIYCSVFEPLRSLEDRQRAQKILRVPDGRSVIGCVATNQPRKDWGLVAQTLRLLLDRGYDVHGWWHTDQHVAEGWSLPQLAEDLRLTDRITVTTELNDRDLARCYASCVATIAPGRGEGFCYPMIESLSCGTPAYHVNYAGGAEILSTTDAFQGQYYRLPVATYHLVGPYALRRPIVNPVDVADRLDRYVSGLTTEGDLTAERARCRAHALRYDWAAVWPAWQAWIKKGLSL